MAKFHKSVQCLIYFCAENPTVKDNPKDVNASIGGEAEFGCSFINITDCNGTIVVWLINGVNVNSQQELVKHTRHFSCETTDNIVTSNLTLLFMTSSDQQWDNSTLVCHALSYGDVPFNKPSASALLRLQGISFYKKRHKLCSVAM